MELGFILYNEDIGPYTWFPTCGCLQNKLLWRMWMQLLPLWIRSHIYTRLHPASDWAWEGSWCWPSEGLPLMGRFGSGPPLQLTSLRLTFSLRLFLSNPSFSISFPGLAPWCEGIPCLLLPIFHLTFVEITLNTSFAHVILSLSSATQRTRTDNFYLEWEGQENVSKGLEIPSSIRDVFDYKS